MNLTVTTRDGIEHTILFDDADADLVLPYKWGILRQPNKRSMYAITRGGEGWPQTLRMHRLLMGVPGVDHANHNGLDNRRANLRLATGSQNMGNQFPRKGSSRFKGVCFDKNRRKWHSKITVDYKQINLGRFATEIEAAQAYDRAALAAWGEFSMLNFPSTEALSRSQAS